MKLRLAGSRNWSRNSKPKKPSYTQSNRSKAASVRGTVIGSAPQTISACHRVKAFFSWVPISRQIPSCDGCGSSNLNDLKPRVPPKFWIWRVPWARLYDLSQKLSLNGRTSLERPARYTRAYSRLRMAIHMIVVLSPWSLRRDALETDLRPRIVAEQIRRLCFRLISQKKLPALAPAV